MNIKKTFALILFTVTMGSLMGFRPADTKAVEDGNYFFIVISGTWTKNKTAYMSAPIFYAGYNDCGKRADYDYERDAKKAWANYLEANYDKDDFGGGSLTHNMQVVDYKQHATGTLLTTKQMVADRMNSWAAEEKEDGYKIERTGFTFECE